MKTIKNFEELKTIADDEFEIKLENTDYWFEYITNNIFTVNDKNNVIIGAFDLDNRFYLTDDKDGELPPFCKNFDHIYIKHDFDLDEFFMENGTITGVELLFDEELSKKITRGFCNE